MGACGDDGGDPGAAASSSSSEASDSTSSSSAPATSSSPATSAPAEAEAVTVSAVDFDFELSEDSYSAGTYTFEVTNTGAMPHNFRVERDGQDVGGTDVLQPGQSATAEVTLEAGDYVFYCGVGQHRANGMEVPVTVAA
nr:cupredoxin domain-containing protein [Geodermatophilus sabuli]